MNIPKMSAIIEAEMKVRDYTDMTTEDVYNRSVGSITTLQSIGLLNPKEYHGYMERLAIIKKASSIEVSVAPAPAPAESE